MDEGRELVYKGELNKRDGEIQVHLFDHALLFTKIVKTKHAEQYKVYRRVSHLGILISSILIYNVLASQYLWNCY